MEVMNTAWALVPPLVAIILALVTKETYTSLFVGIVIGAILVSISLTGGVDPITTINCITQGTAADGESAIGLIPAVTDNAGIFVFLVMLGIMVALVNAAGGAAAFGHWAAKHVKGRIGSQVATFVLGILIFIDDYFNCLTVGSVMRPVTDAKRVSRAKLAFIIDATAAPICMIAPVSSWAAAVSGVAEDLNVNGIQLFISAIPFNFYSLLMIVFVLAICVMGFDYGPMAKAEIEAWRDGELGSLGGDTAVENTKANLWDMLLPVVMLIICCIIGMLYVGGFWDPESGVAGDVINSFGNTDAFVALPWGSLIALVLAFIYMLARRVITFKDAAATFVSGFNAMVPAILVLTFAVTLKGMTGALGAAPFVSGIMDTYAAGLYAFLPAIIFLVAAFLAFATGTSWGTFGILIPIVMAVFQPGTTLLTIGISACLAGAVCGDHCSPISDTTVMASAGANVNHVDHVSTQLPYVLTVAAVSFVCFLVAGFVQNAFICLALGIVLTVAALFILKKTVGVTAEYKAEA